MKLGPQVPSARALLPALPASLTLSLSLSWLLPSGTAFAGPGEAPVREVEIDSARCEHLRGVADAESAVLTGPSVFARLGYLDAGAATSSASSSQLVGPSALPFGAPSARLTAGLSYSFSRLQRGLLVRRRADAECRRARAESALREATYLGLRLGASSALQARAEVLAQGLPRAEDGLTALKQAVSTGDAAMDELNAYRLRLTDLRDELHRAQLERSQLGLHGAPAAPLGELWSELTAATTGSERVSQELRGAANWDVSLQGGYDQTFAAPSRLPVFGAVTVSYELGGLWQPAANARASEGLRRWLAQGDLAVDHGLNALMDDLRATLASERARLDEVRTLVKDLEAQVAQVEPMQTSRVRRFRDQLNLELTGRRADAAYLEAHVRTLEQMLGGSQ
ncbi:MAG TPA: hypothetical protein VFB81_25350 [Myxococcales bacterium]|nr:hypothetical protein [Myxococcales bacterium]